MIGRLANKGTGFALTLGVAALAAIAFVALATPSNAGTDPAWMPVESSASADVDFNRNLTALQASHGLRYQCMRDFRQCTRDISVSSSWTAALAQQAFDGEYAACCYEAELCGDFLSSVGSRVISRDYDEDIASACAVINDAQSTLYSTHATLMAKATADAGGAVRP